ncbi:unnamed protein product [Oncorhynchus mykiss]|uniref:Importin N-terminal domain-containing protein n=1 Tax=Oncorhynchus mykiss TaxID=8022 RepID=A0A060WSZ7_ONCMY|nr:unnamed protein product [Oncorhynchus mykiss]
MGVREEHEWSKMADHVQSLAQLEILCKQLYETTETGVRLQAEKALVEFTNSPDCLSKCQLLLERGSSSYSQLLAATCLSKLVSRTNNPLPLEQRIDIRNYVLNYLATRPKLAEFVTQALIQLYSRIIKLQCLAKVFGPLELCDLLPHFRLQT